MTHFPLCSDISTGIRYGYEIIISSIDGKQKHRILVGNGFKNDSTSKDT